jgi:hypothetical protein
MQVPALGYCFLSVSHVNEHIQSSPGAEKQSSSLLHGAAFFEQLAHVPSRGSATAPSAHMPRIAMHVAILRTLVFAIVSTPNSDNLLRIGRTQGTHEKSGMSGAIATANQEAIHRHTDSYSAWSDAFDLIQPARCSSRSKAGARPRRRRPERVSMRPRHRVASSDPPGCGDRTHASAGQDAQASAEPEEE